MNMAILVFELVWMGEIVALDCIAMRWWGGMAVAGSALVVLAWMVLFAYGWWAWESVWPGEGDTLVGWCVGLALSVAGAISSTLLYRASSGRWHLVRLPLGFLLAHGLVLLAAFLVLGAAIGAGYIH